MRAGFDGPTDLGEMGAHCRNRRCNGLSVATRNVRDFEGLGLDVDNPWTPPWQASPGRGRYRAAR